MRYSFRAASRCDPRPSRPSSTGSRRPVSTRQRSPRVRHDRGDVHLHQARRESSTVMLGCRRGEPRARGARALDGAGCCRADLVRRAAAAHPLAIVDPDTLHELPERRVGEIWISSPSVSPGYFRRPDATAETFGFTLAGTTGRTCAAATSARSSTASSSSRGRLKDVIILRGRNIYPQDIEAAAAALSPALGVGAAFELDGQSAPVGVVIEYDRRGPGSRRRRDSTSCSAVVSR